jgi:hypothetical protein
LPLEDAFRNHITTLNDKEQCFLEGKGGDTMVNKRNLIVVALVTFCLTVSLFSIIPRSSSQGIHDYNPWLDINDDGVIDGSDIIMMARAFGAGGDPVNKTALLYDVNATFTELLSEIDSSNASLTDLRNRVTALEENNMMTNASLVQLLSRIDSLNTTLTNRINDLETEIAILNATKLGTPDKDSGWMSIGQGSEIIYTHNLNTTDLLVYMIGKFNDSSSPYIHQIQYGSDNMPPYQAAGARWYDLTSTTIRVRREIGDQNWVWVRLILWKIP